MKTNIDGVMWKDLEKGDGGVIVHDYDGRFLARASHFSRTCLILKMLSCGHAS
jgi:hypothetical protein